MYELEDVEKWEEEVMTSELPVVLDIYADWCGPCRTLTPLLTKLVEEKSDTARLVKVNSDKFPQISSALSVTALPSVFLVY